MKKMTIAVAAVLVLLIVPQSVFAAQMLVPGGQVIGLEIGDDTVTVAAFEDTLGASAQQAGLRVGDRITHINGKPVNTAMQIRQALERSEPRINVTVLRDGKTIQLQMKPQITDQGPKLGIYLKSGVTGVGTVTWYDPDSGSFGALGHSVNDASGNVLKMVSGKAYAAQILSVRKGRIGDPGQLMGALDPLVPVGSLSKNTAQGVFGKLAFPAQGTALPVAAKADIKTGDAVIRSTVCGNEVQEYSVKILKIYPNTNANERNLLLKVTDPTLLNTTGGIVQGMSGSPIIQDGKLIGAVTHVLVNDPTTGYGIFIENMLDAAA